MTISQVVSHVRQANQWDRAQLAMKLDARPEDIRNWENGDQLPNFSQLLLLRDLAQVSLDELVDGDERLRQQLVVEPSVHHLRSMNGWTFLSHYWWLLFAIGGYLSWLIPYFVRLFH